MKIFRKKGFSIQILNRIRVNVAVKKAAKWVVILMMARYSVDVSVGIRADVDIRADGAQFQRPADAEVYREAVFARLSVMFSAALRP